MKRCWLLVLLLLSGCARDAASDPAAAGQRLHVVCTTGMIGDLARRVGGDMLAKHDAAHADLFRRRTESYSARLAKLHDETRAEVATIPSERRVLVTSHDAFRYFGRAYDIEVRGVQGINTEAEASVRDVASLVDFLVKRQVKAVFVETSVNPRNMLSLIEGGKARAHD